MVSDVIVYFILPVDERPFFVFVSVIKSLFQKMINISISDRFKPCLPTTVMLSSRVMVILCVELSFIE